MKMEPNTTHAMCNCPAELVAASADGRALLLAIRLSPWGEVHSTNGTYVMDDEAAAEIVAAFAKHGTALPIDREHETLPQNTPATGSRGAVGWIEDVYPEPGNGLMGKVRWTDEGRALVRADAFRYLSPVLMVRKSDRRAVALHSAAMTNKPAIPQMDRLAASQAPQVAQAENILIHPVPAAVADQVWDEPAIPHPSQLHEVGDVERKEHASRLALIANRDAEVARMVREHFSLKPDADADTVCLAIEMAGMRAAEERRKVAAEDEKAWEVVQGFFKRHLINSHSPRSVRAALMIARDNPDALEAMYGMCVSKIPPGITVAPLSPNYRWRHDALCEIQNHYHANQMTQKLTSLVDFVNAELRARKMEPLTEYERGQVEQMHPTLR